MSIALAYSTLASLALRHPYTHTYTITHPACNTTDTTDVHTPSYVLYCSFLQYSGRLVHKGDWGDALPRGKKKKKPPDV